MGKLLEGSLPQPTPVYNIGMFNQLIRKLQLILGISVHTTSDALETEAINYFLSN